MRQIAGIAQPSSLDHLSGDVSAFSETAFAHNGTSRGLGGRLGKTSPRHCNFQRYIRKPGRALATFPLESIASVISQGSRNLQKLCRSEQRAPSTVAKIDCWTARKILAGEYDWVRTESLNSPFLTGIAWLTPSSSQRRLRCDLR